MKVTKNFTKESVMANEKVEANGFTDVFLNTTTEYNKAKLEQCRFISLNEVYEQLGFPRTREGMVLGWVAEDGDTFVLDRKATDDGDIEVTLNPKDPVAEPSQSLKLPYELGQKNPWFVTEIGKRYKEVEFLKAVLLGLTEEQMVERFQMPIDAIRRNVQVVTKGREVKR